MKILLVLHGTSGKIEIILSSERNFLVKPGGEYD
jgi:hypothetical protein